MRDEGKLLEARKRAVSCAQPSCPDVVEQKCAEWIDQIDATLPSIIVSLQGSDADAGNVIVKIDGQVAEEGLSGRPHDLDPGPHTIVVVVPGKPPIEDKVVVAQGEQNRKVVLQAGGGAPATGASEGGISPLVWIGFGVAGAGVVLGAVTGGLALSKTSELEDACGGKLCSESLRGDYDAANTMAHVSTAGFALAGAGAVVGVIGLFLGTGDDDSADTAAGVQLLPTPGGMVIRGRF